MKNKLIIIEGATMAGTLTLAFLNMEIDSAVKRFTEETGARFSSSKVIEFDDALFLSTSMYGSVEMQAYPIIN